MKREYHGLDIPGKLLYLSGVPINYIKKEVSPQSFNYMPIGLNRGKSSISIAMQSQMQFTSELFANIGTIGSTRLYGVGSVPTEQPILEFCALVSKKFQTFKFEDRSLAKILWVDLGRPPYEKLKDSEFHELVVIHNVNTNSDSRRFELVRDFAKRYSESTVIIAAVTPNIIETVHGRLGLELDGALQLDRSTHKTFV